MPRNSPKTRVPDPTAAGMRINVPGRPDATDILFQAPAADEFYPNTEWGELDGVYQRPVQQQAIWIGNDGGYGLIGPGSNSGHPSPALYGVGPGWAPAGEAAIGVLPAITRCLSVIVEPIVRTRWHYRRGPDYLDRPLWIADPMLTGSVPGPTGPLLPAGKRLDGHSFFTTVLAHAILWGRGAFTFIEASDGTPVPGSLLVLNPFAIDIDETGTIEINPGQRTAFTTDTDGRFTLAGDTWRVAILPGLPPSDGLFPEGVLLRHWETMRVGARLSRYVGSTFLSGVPSGYLQISTPNADENDARRLRAAWEDAHGRGTRATAVLNASVSYNPIALSPLDAAAGDMVHMSRADIAHAFGLSAIWLDEGTTGLTYNNAVDRRRDLVTFTLTGWGERLTELITAILPYGTSCTIDWNSFMSPNFADLVPVLTQAVTANLMTESEARQYLGLEPYKGPDPRWQPHRTAPTGDQP